MRMWPLAVVAALASCVPMSEDRQALLVRSSSDGATEGALVVAAKELPTQGFSATLCAGLDSYDRLSCLAGAGVQSDTGDTAALVAIGIEFPWNEREPIQTRIELDAFWFSGRAVYQVAIAGAIDSSERIKVRTLAGIGVSF